MVGANAMDEQGLDNWAALAFDAAPVGIILAEHRRVRACNETFAQMTLYQRQELLGQSCRIFYDSDEEFEQIRNVGLGALQANEPYADNRLLRQRGGSRIWCRFRARALAPERPLERVVMSFAVINDLSLGAHLTVREREVLSLMQDGLTSKEIGGRLGLSPRTIEDVRSRLIHRFGVRRASELLVRLTDFR
ncbi:MAG: PAS and helix-turn-helix domain-containing protein [Neomegalonema sp.]|nr:PAS and helix-turn-helix domain-containing protein [Neomegalonema sp.]